MTLATLCGLTVRSGRSLNHLSKRFAGKTLKGQISSQAAFPARLSQRQDAS